MTPYASGRRWTLYAGDCLTMRHLIPTDASLISDVPYGMDWDTDSTRFSGGGRAWERIKGDDQPFDPTPWLDYPHVALWGSNHYAQRLPVGTTLVWVKRADHLLDTFLSDAEIGWVKGGHGVYVHNQQFSPPSRSMEAGGPGGGPLMRAAHPTQKPIALMMWSMDRAKVPLDGLVVDPYCGSGTTGVAALRRGGSFIGMECEPEHLVTAARRLADAEAGGIQIGMFTKEAV